MDKLLWRYLIYFAAFIGFVQIMESAPLQEVLAKIGLEVNFESLGTYAPLFLSALLIDITYRIGKRQNEIAKQQIEIQKQQIASQEYQLYHKLYKTIKTIKKSPSSLILDLCIYLEDNFYYEYKLDYWVSKRQELKQLQNDYDNCKIDLDLILGENISISQQYDHILFMCDYLIRQFDEFAKNRELNIEKLERPYIAGMSNDEKNDFILKHIPEKRRPYMKMYIERLLNSEKIDDKFFLEDIEKRYRRYNHNII